MQKSLLIILLITAQITFAQSGYKNNAKERQGFTLGLGLGAGVLSLNTQDTVNTTFSTTLPNIKIGYMLNQRWAILAMLPGANYEYHGKDRGFEGLIIAGQYWLKEKWWVLGGIGLTFDAPAFYTVDDPKTAVFNTGFPAISMATGYEIWQKGRFALDLQYRVFIGTANMPNNGQRQGLSNMFIVGFNWY